MIFNIHVAQKKLSVGQLKEVVIIIFINMNETILIKRVLFRLKPSITYLDCFSRLIYILATNSFLNDVTWNNSKMSLRKCKAFVVSLVIERSFVWPKLVKYVVLKKDDETHINVCWSLQNLEKIIYISVLLRTKEWNQYRKIKTFKCPISNCPTSGKTYNIATMGWPWT